MGWRGKFISCWHNLGSCFPPLPVGGLCCIVHKCDLYTRDAFLCATNLHIIEWEGTWRPSVFLPTSTHLAKRLLLRRYIHHRGSLSWSEYVTFHCKISCSLRHTATRCSGSIGSLKWFLCLCSLVAVFPAVWQTYPEAAAVSAPESEQWNSTSSFYLLLFSKSSTSHHQSLLSPFWYPLHGCFL